VLPIVTAVYTQSTFFTFRSFGIGKYKIPEVFEPGKRVFFRKTSELIAVK